jgi:hypothetical protein
LLKVAEGMNGNGDTPAKDGIFDGHGIVEN